MANILFVVGSTPLSASDQAIFDRLAVNHGVTTVTGAYPGGDYDAIVVSESISSGNIGSYVGVTTPLLCGELAAWDELGLTASGSGGTTSASSLTVVPGTALSAGLSGSVTAASSSVAWGRPSSGVARAGTVAVNVGGDDNLAVVFYADAGTTFASGSGTMAEKRVAFGFTSDSTVVADENIWKIFDAAIAWMVGGGSGVPGGGSYDGAPGEVFDLREWHLTTPRDSGSGDAEQIDQPQLATFELPDTGGHAWYVEPDTGRLVAAATPNGFTTSGESGATRMELRQRTQYPDYQLVGFDPHTATQRMTAICYPDATTITGGSNPRQQVIFWQVHGSSGSPPLLLDCDHNSVSEPRIRLYKDGPGLSDLIRPYTAGDPIGVRCIVSGGQVSLYVAVTDNPNDLDSVTPLTFQSTEFADDQDWYFKIGAYNKTTISSGSSGRSVNKIAYLELNGVVLGPNPVGPPAIDTTRFFLAG